MHARMRSGRVKSQCNPHFHPPRRTSQHTLCRIRMPAVSSEAQIVYSRRPHAPWRMVYVFSASGSADRSI